MLNEFFKIQNSFLCINFTSSIRDKININDHSNLRRIHIFVFNADNVNILALKGILNAARRRRIKIIIHYFNKDDVKNLKNQLKGVYKDKYFHFKLDDKFEASYSSEKKIAITYRNVCITTISNNKKSIQTIVYGYEENEV